MTVRAPNYLNTNPSLSSHILSFSLSLLSLLACYARGQTFNVHRVTLGCLSLQFFPLPSPRSTSTELLTFQNRGWINQYRRVVRFAVLRILPSIPSTQILCGGRNRGFQRREREREGQGMVRYRHFGFVVRPCGL